MDTIARVRRKHFVRHRSIRETSRDLHLSRNTVKEDEFFDFVQRDAGIGAKEARADYTGIEKESLAFSAEVVKPEARDLRGEGEAVADAGCADPEATGPGG